VSVVHVPRTFAIVVEGQLRGEIIAMRVRPSPGLSGLETQAILLRAAMLLGGQGVTVPAAVAGQRPPTPVPGDQLPGAPHR
jgi:hypothetical protein